METQIPGKRRKLDWSLKPCTSDRLTDLPDEPLARILGMLPTKDAAALTLISPNKFMSPFSYLTSFHFDDSPISHCVKSPNQVERTPHFKKFVDYVLQTSRSDKIDTFTLRFGRLCLNYICKADECRPYLEPARINAWISFPLARGVRELDLCINVKKKYRKLPRSIFVCETLEMLKIDSNLDIDFNDIIPFPIRLPRLKLLHLRTFLFKEDEFVTKLVDSCPVLEDLLLACRWECGDVFAISSPSLLKLDLTLKRIEPCKSSISVIIQTPNLQYLKYWDNLAHHYAISDMNALVQVDISIFWNLRKDESCWNLCSFLKSCSTVSHLTLRDGCVQCLDHDELKNHLPMFPNLNHLELEYRIPTYWGKVLVKFLECSPSLTTLVFPKGITVHHLNHMETENIKLEGDCWTTTQTSPSCCKSHLKKIVIMNYSGTQRELDLIQFLLGKALVLESLNIPSSKKFEDLNLTPVLIQSSLQEMPRASKFCSIRVL